MVLKGVYHEREAARLRPRAGTIILSADLIPALAGEGQAERDSLGLIE